jgi:predicted ester cyclase
VSPEAPLTHEAGSDSSVVDPVAANEATVRRIFDGLINGRDLSVPDDICTDDFVLHVPGLQLPPGPEALKQFARTLHMGFPDIHVVIDDLIATEDGVAVRWYTDRQTHTGEYRGLPPTGRSITVTGMTFHRLESGRVVSGWVEADSVGLAQQLGVVPPDDVSSGARLRFVLGSLVRIGYLQVRHSVRSRSSPRA